MKSGAAGRAFRVIKALIALAIGVLVTQCGLDGLLSDIAPSTDDPMTAETLAQAFGETPRPFSTLRHDLVTELALDRLDQPVIRGHLMRQRLAINAYVIGRVLEVRLPWIQGLERWLKILGCALVLILLGPIVVLLRTPVGPMRWRRVVGSWPYFAIAAAASLMLYGFMVDSLAGIQSAQISLGSIGSPAVATTDAALHYMITTDDVGLTSLVSRVVEAREIVATDPIGALGMVEHIWSGIRAAHDSTLLSGTARVMRSAGWLLDLYLLALVVTTAILVATLVVPVISSLARYPVQVVEDRASPRIWPFVKTQLGVFWREMRAFVWLLLPLLFFTAFAVIAIRLMSYPIAVAWLKTILATELLLDQGTPLPDLAILLSAVALTAVVLATTIAVMFPIGIVLSKAHVVIRVRLRTKRRFRDFPAFWSTQRGLFRKVAGSTIGCAVAAFATYFAVLALSPPPSLTIWLPALVIAPIFGLLSWLLRVVPNLWRLAWVDPLEMKHELESP